MKYSREVIKLLKAAEVFEGLPKPKWVSYSYIARRGLRDALVFCVHNGLLAKVGRPSDEYVLLSKAKVVLAAMRMEEREPKAESEVVMPDSLPKSATNKGKGVNARMLEKLLEDKECHGWTCSQWASFLKCSKPSVVATKAWEQLREYRENQAAERRTDRHRR